VSPGRVLIVVDTNENTVEPRMQLLDPVAMTTSVFSSNGNTYSAAGCGAGTYSSARGQAVLLDYTSNCFRGFSPGEAGGGGSIFSQNVSGFLSRVIEIRNAALTGVVERRTPSATLRLESVFPNPFISGTSVRFSLPSPGLVRVTVHDASGRLVRLLAKTNGDAGPKSLWWDGRDDRGYRVPHGTYFIRVEAGEAFVARKVTVVR